MSTITFVTAFYSSPTDEIIENFRKLAKTGIQLCVYNENCNVLPESNNVKIMRPLDTSISEICKTVEYNLPSSTNANEDYFIFLNSKCDYIENTIKTNPWNSTHFAWIDFNIFSILKNEAESKEYLKTLSLRTLCPSFLAIAGWFKTKSEIYDFNGNLDSVRWRFLDKFFIGDKDSLLEMAELTKLYFPKFLRTYRVLTWEVNFWNWLETVVGWSPTWYYALFDDSIIKLPSRLYGVSLLKNSTTELYDYPTIQCTSSQYYETSASHIYFQGQHILNTRFVNYYLLEGGQYYMSHQNRFIITKNMVSILDEESMSPLDYEMMNDNTIELEEPVYPENDVCNIFGLEDIRLYEYNNQLRFIATNRNYAPIYKNRMVVGDYNIEECSFDNCRLIESPYNSQYEKNWVPINFNGEECFIYSWFPMEIYRLCSKTNTIESVCKHTNTLTAPNFYRVRGSSCFIEVGEELVGVVHFSEDIFPRQYFHMLVALEKETYKPLRYSDTFYFKHIGVEFCTGFCVKDENYIFWISKKDRNACKVTVAIDKMPLIFDFEKI
jgi:hypothetical protein